MFWNYPVPLAAYAIGAAIALVLMLPPLRRFLFDKWVTPALVATLFIIGMIILPSHNHLLGDGLTHINASDRIFSPTEPLDVFVHYMAGRIAGSMEVGYRAVSFLAGLFYLLGISLMFRLGRDKLERGIILLAFLATATVQFYFGYVESYALLNLFTLYYIYFAWRDLTEERIGYLPLLFFLLLLMSHFSGIVLLPSLLYLYSSTLKKKLLYLVLPLMILGALVAWQVKPEMILVPLSRSEFSAYTLFSGAHLADLIRVLLLVSPGFILALLSRRCDSPVRFVLLALAGALVFTILVDPKIGAFRDWDLLSLFAIPLAALVALRAPRHPLTVALLVLVIATRIVPWLLFNNSLQVEFAKNVINDDMHYSRLYDNGYRLRSWGVFLKEVGDFEGAAQALEKRLDCQPDDVHALTMLVPSLFKLGRYRAAHERALQGLRADPGNVNFLYKAIYTAFRSGELERAEQMLLNSPPRFRDSPLVARLYAGIRGAQGHHREAVDLARRFSAEDTDGHLPYILARSAVAVEEIQFARTLLDQALALDSNDRQIRSLADSLRALDKQ